MKRKTCMTLLLLTAACCSISIAGGVSLFPAGPAAVLAADDARQEDPAPESGTSAENEYVRIGRYEGVEVAKVENVPEITDYAVDNNIDTILKGFSEHREVSRPAEEGDAVTVDYTVSVNGEDFPEGGASGCQLIIGDNYLFTGFDQTMIGHSAGDSWDVDHTYSDTYAVAPLAGQTAQFHVTLNKVEEVRTPVLSDDFVQKVSEKSKTVDEYREEVRNVLEENNRDYIRRQIRADVWQSILDTAEVLNYPEDQLQEEIDSFYEYYQKGADLYEMEFEKFLEELKISPEHFKEEASAAAESNVRENLVAQLIADTIGMDLSEEVLASKKEAMAEQLGFDSTEELIKDAPNEAYIDRMAVRELVMDWAADHATQTESE